MYQSWEIIITYFTLYLATFSFKEAKNIFKLFLVIFQDPNTDKQIRFNRSIVKIVDPRVDAAPGSVWT